MYFAEDHYFKRKDKQIIPSIKEKWEKVEYIENGVERKFPYCDYYIYPQSKWNFAFCGTCFEVDELSFDIPFNPEKPPISIKAEVVEIEWDFNFGYCDRLPKTREPIGDKQTIKLIPYGCTNLRMTEIPLISI